MQMEMKFEWRGDAAQTEKEILHEIHRLKQRLVDILGHHIKVSDKDQSDWGFIENVFYRFKQGMNREIGDIADSVDLKGVLS